MLFIVCLFILPSSFKMYIKYGYVLVQFWQHQAITYANVDPCLPYYVTGRKSVNRNGFRNTVFSFSRTIYMISVEGARYLWNVTALLKALLPGHYFNMFHYFHSTDQIGILKCLKNDYLLMLGFNCDVKI